MLLDLDALEHICDSCQNAPSLLSLSLTSRALRTVAVKRLLRMGPIVLRKVHQVRAFHIFVFADPETRMPHVLRCLLDILRRAEYLEALGIQQADLTLPALRALCLPTQCGGTEDNIQHTRSRTGPKTLRLAFPENSHPNRSGPWVLTSVELDERVFPLSPMLENLEITSHVLELEDVGAPFPALRSLILRELGSLAVDVLVQKFPALDGTLDVGSSSPCDRDDILKVYSVSSLRRIRCQNLQLQAQQSWRRLDRLVGPILFLFVLAVACPVRHLMVDDFEDRDQEQLLEMLREMTPTHLKLSIWWSRHYRVFKALFPPQTTSRLTHLVLVTRYFLPDDEVVLEDFDEASRTIYWQSVLTKIISAVRQLHLLTHFRLAIHYSDSIGFVPSSEHFKQSIRHPDQKATAEGLLQEVPSLRYVFLTTSGYIRVGDLSSNGPDTWPGNWILSSGWGKAGLGQPGRGGNQVEQLGKEEIEEMLTVEDLIVSKCDEHVLRGFDSKRMWDVEETQDWEWPS
ncbi:hypothetical protein OH77DRAFT_287164 [Trametes cingulata]|nr:hypothetical protein OH77DRAFT_287164 [Trametes cingulata]